MSKRAILTHIASVAFGAVCVLYGPTAYHVLIELPPNRHTGAVPEAVQDRIVPVPEPTQEQVMAAPAPAPARAPERSTLAAVAKHLGLSGLKCAVVQDGPSTIEGFESDGHVSAHLGSLERAWGISGHLYCVPTSGP